MQVRSVPLLRHDAFACFRVQLLSKCGLSDGASLTAALQSSVAKVCSKKDLPGPVRHAVGVLRAAVPEDRLQRVLDELSAAGLDSLPEWQARMALIGFR